MNASAPGSYRGKSGTVFSAASSDSAEAHIRSDSVMGSSVIPLIDKAGTFKSEAAA